MGGRAAIYLVWLISKGLLKRAVAAFFVFWQRGLAEMPRAERLEAFVSG